MAVIRIPIDFKNPRVTSLTGNAFARVQNLPTSDVDHELWELIADVEGKIYGIVTVPNEISITPAAKFIIEILANATIGVSSMAVAWKDIGDGNDLDVALTPITTQDVVMPGTAFELKEAVFFAATQPVAKKQIIVEVFHDGDKAEDTLAVNTLLLRGFLEITI